MKNLNVSIEGLVLGYQTRQKKDGSPFHIAQVYDQRQAQAMEINGIDPVAYPANSRIRVGARVYATRSGDLGLQAQSVEALK